MQNEDLHVRRLSQRTQYRIRWLSGQSDGENVSAYHAHALENAARRSA